MNKKQIENADPVPVKSREWLTEHKKEINDRLDALRELFNDEKSYDFDLSGQIIELVQTQDKYTDLKRGDIGVIEMVRMHNDMTDQTWVKWENGSNLMLIDGDNYHMVGWVERK